MSWFNTKNARRSEGNLQNVFNYALPLSKGLAGAGGANLGDAAKYFKNITSGSRPALLQTAAPETNAAQSTSDAQQRQLEASGTGRGGGVAATNVTRQSDLDAKINNALFGARPEAAKSLASVGGTQLGQAMSALGIGSQATATSGEMSNQAAATRAKFVDDMIQTAVKALV